MDAMPAPLITGFDTVTEIVAAACYLAVAVAALAQWPRDIRTRVFMAFAAGNVVSFGAGALAWLLGARTLTDLPRWAMAAILLGLAEAALLLFHFSQVFPRRRGWIRSSGPQMAIGYVLVPCAILALILTAPKNIVDASGGYLALALVFGFPMVVLLTMVLPVAAIVSFVRSYQDGRREPDVARARVPIALLLVSQIAGGALSFVAAPILATLSPGGAAEFTLTAVMWLLGLGTPLAFALAAWKYDVLAIDADAERGLSGV